MWSRLHVRRGDPPHDTSPTWGPPPPCKQALKLDKARVWRFWTDSRTSPGYFISIALFNNLFISAKRVCEKNVKQKQSKTLIGVDIQIHSGNEVQSLTVYFPSRCSLHSKWLKKRFTKNKCKATLWASMIFTELQQVRILWFIPSLVSRRMRRMTYELSLVFQFSTSNSDKFCSLRPNIILGSTDFFLDSQIRPSPIRFYFKYWYSYLPSIRQTLAFHCCSHSTPYVPWDEIQMTRSWLFQLSALSLIAMHAHNDGDHLFVIKNSLMLHLLLQFSSRLVYLNLIFCTIAVQSICTYSEYILSA